MPNWLYEFLYVLALSKKTQWALICGFIAFFEIHLLGWYSLSNFELQGPAQALQDAIAQKMGKKYDKIALLALFSFLVVAYKFYQKDKGRFL